ncbi:hypothetical protein [Mesorhizobium sp. NZP2077]|uniref:hypothetical protein n=1 Tax=Mesorhizobium sp. NZP2077 TaxID=2483404 RepID=UPI001556FD0D|nr:hypothetical protein [Mesorhizobium sp. NZP2077]QKC83283.1 hypothetical protein EB232_18150 [Mesorhizobium sp. NZP2077]QKD16800.1 hypothetical protein HGP13_17935 [Mesorhizobium sp. NZP2077]
MIILRSVKGSNLTPAEVDGNFTDLDDRVTDIEDSPPVAVPPSNMTVAGTQWTIYYPDGLTFGPFTLPQANFRPSIGIDIDADTDGTFTVTSAHSNRYLRYAGSEILTVILPGDLPADTEVSFRQVGDGAISFPESTDVLVNGYDGFLNQTAGRGSTVTAKVVPDGGEWDLIGRLAEDVTA